MNISISNESFISRISELPITGQEIITSIEGLKLVTETVKEIGTAIIGFAKELGIIPDIGIEDLGARATQAIEKGLGPDKFDSTQDWVNALLKDDWGFDPEAAKDLSTEEKVYMGIGTVAAFIVEKFAGVPIKDLLILAFRIPDLFTEDRMKVMADILLDSAAAIEALVKYLTGEDKTHSIIDLATDTLMGIEKTVNPAISDDEAYNKAVSYKA